MSITSAMCSSGWKARMLATCWPRAALLAVEVGLGALGVAAARHRDDDVLLGDQVLHGQIALVRGEPGAAVVAVLVDDLAELVADDLPLPLRTGEDVLEVADARLEL